MGSMESKSMNTDWGPPFYSNRVGVPTARQLLQAMPLARDADGSAGVLLLTVHYGLALQDCCVHRQVLKALSFLLVFLKWALKRAQALKRA